tara:strand:+ start:4965 stop:6578 length:1614 start_codon:yes stop_codon:yes gene_type:complete
VVQFSSEELKGRRIYLLVEIDFGTFGHFRLSTEPLTIPGEGGGRFDGGLDSLTFTDSVDLFSTSETNRSVSINAFLPLDVSELVARGLDPSRATASLSQWVEGSNYEDRRKVLPPTELRDPQYGESYEPFKFSIRSNLFDDGSMLPPVDALIDGVTFPSSLSWQRGPAYPWIFGTPGTFRNSITGTSTHEFCAPVYAVTIDGSTEGFVCAGHEMTPGTIANVVKKTAISTVHTKTVLTARDGRGRLISYIPYAAPLSPFGGMSTLEGEDFVASFSAGGGIMNEQQTAPRRGMGEIIEYLLDYAPRINMDRGRTRTAATLLNALKIDGVITEPVEVWRWLRSNLLPYAPVSLAHGAEGMFPIVWDKDITENDTVADINAQRDEWDRTSPVTVEHLDGEPRNNFSIAYRVNGISGETSQRATLDGRLESSNSYARTSYQRYGARSKPEEEAISFYESSDVDAVLSWWSRIFGFPIRTVEYTAPIEWGWLEAGSYLRFTDERLNITNQICVVQAIEWSEQQIIGLRLVWLEDLPRDDRLI